MALFLERRTAIARQNSISCALPEEDVEVKLLRYSRKTEPAALARMGGIVGDDWVADLRAGHALFLFEEKGNAKAEDLAEIFMPPYLTQFLYLGEPGWEALAETYAWMAESVRNDVEALGLRGERLFLPLTECRLYAPLRPSKLIVTEANDRARTGPARARTDGIPSAFLKPASSLIGPGRDIVKPAATRELDCEATLAVVIGQRCKHVPPEKALEVVAGYSIVNDVGARDISEVERESGYLLLGRGCDTFAPLGPWLVTRDEIPDPMNLQVRARVNGESRQDGNTAALPYSVQKLVAYFSQMTLFPGDIITIGSPGMLAADGKRTLNAGDLLEAEIESIGVLRNAVVDEPL
jgi:acylpyruvate hydrolase